PDLWVLSYNILLPVMSIPEPVSVTSEAYNSTFSTGIISVIILAPAFNQSVCADVSAEPKAPAISSILVAKLILISYMNTCRYFYMHFHRFSIQIQYLLLIDNYMLRYLYRDHNQVYIRQKRKYPLPLLLKLE